MAYKIDRRVEKTRKALKESLVSLLKENSLNGVSIKEICENAKVNRTTFYKHYKSQYELFEDIENDCLRDIESRLIHMDHTKDSSQDLERVIYYFKENRDTFSLLMSKNYSSKFLSHLKEIPFVKDKILEMSGVDHNRSMKNFTIIFVIDGTYSAIKRWMEDDCKESVEMLAKRIDAIARKLLQ